MLSHMQHLPRPSYTHQLSGTHLPQVLTLHSGVVHPQHVLCLHRPRTAPLYFCRTCPPPHCLAVGLLHAKPLVVGTAHVELGSCLQGRVLRTATLCHRQHVAKPLHLQQHTTSSSESLSYFKPNRMLSWARSYDVGMHPGSNFRVYFTQHPPPPPSPTFATASTTDTSLSLKHTAAVTCSLGRLPLQLHHNRPLPAGSAPACLPLTRPRGSTAVPSPASPAAHGTGPR